MLRLQPILLGLSVAFANMICACVTAGGESACTAQIAGYEERSEHSHAKPDCHHRGDDQNPQDDKSNSRDCGHCTGSVNIDAAKAKTSVPPPSASFFGWLPQFAAPAPAIDDAAMSLDHCGLSPPFTSATLLSLSCCLNN